MKIINNARPKVTIHNLESGDVFEYNNHYYMRVKDKRNNAFNLQENTLVRFTSSTKVCKIDCELIIKEYSYENNQETP